MWNHFTTTWVILDEVIEVCSKELQVESGGKKKNNYIYIYKISGKDMEYLAGSSEFVGFLFAEGFF